MSARILLVEDNDQNRYLATFLLERAGFTVTHARDGRQGIERARSDPPDAILMDIQMPEMDGLEAAREILATPGLENVPIIAVTSRAMAGDRAKAFAIGMQGYIEKPISPETFASDVQRLIAGNRHENP
jgi:CheY-like chemotaxis protein